MNWALVGHLRSVAEDPLIALYAADCSVPLANSVGPYGRSVGSSGCRAQ